MAGDADANDSENPPAVVNGNPLHGGLDLSAPTHAIKAENTSARSNASAGPQVSSSLTPFNESYLGKHGHSIQTQQQFSKATSRSEGEKPLSNADGIIRHLQSSLRQGQFDGPANQFQTEGTGTVQSQPDRVVSVDVANADHKQGTIPYRQ